MNAQTFDGLPGAELITQGLRDLAAGRQSVESLLVEIGSPRLRQLGIPVRSMTKAPEHRLYALLARESRENAHSRYNGLVRRLVSFERAMACAS